VVQSTLPARLGGINHRDTEKPNDFSVSRCLRGHSQRRAARHRLLPRADDHV